MGGNPEELGTLVSIHEKILWQGKMTVINWRLQLPVKQIELRVIEPTVLLPTGNMRRFTEKIKSSFEELSTGDMGKNEPRASWDYMDGNQCKTSGNNFNGGTTIYNEGLCRILTGER